MDIPSTTQAAVARWIADGVTSLTHPVLAQLFRDCFAPLGIEADWLEAEPFSSLEAGQPDGWLRCPRWNPAGLDLAHPDAAALQRWAREPELVAVGPDGVLRLPESTDERTAWATIRPSVIARERVRAFLAAAAASLLFDPEAAAIYRDGDAAGFVRRIWAQMDGTMDYTAGAAANIPAPEGGARIPGALPPPPANLPSFPD